MSISDIFNYKENKDKLEILKVEYLKLRNEYITLTEERKELLKWKSFIEEKELEEDNKYRNLLIKTLEIIREEYHLNEIFEEEIALRVIDKDIDMIKDILENNSPYTNDLEDTILFVRPNLEACDICKSLYLEDGNIPKLFLLPQLIANGTNFNRDEKDWKPTIGSLHEYCGCSLLVMPKGCTFNNDGELVIGESNIVNKLKEERQFIRNNFYEIAKTNHSSKKFKTFLSYNEIINLINSISHSVKDLLWFEDDFLANIDTTIDEITYKVESIGLDIPTATNDPSAISLKLPIEKNDNPDYIPYFLEYRELSPKERYKYLNWLKDISQPIDIGYILIFYYGLERHLLTDTYEDALKIIYLLRDTYKDDTLQGYFNKWIALASIFHEDDKALKSIEWKYIDNDLMFTLKITNDMPIYPDDIIRLSPSVGWFNTRYMYGEDKSLFILTMKNILYEKCGQYFYSIEDDTKITHKHQLKIYFSNSSISSKTHSLFVSDILSEPAINSEIYDLIETTHEKVKEILRERRKEAKRLEKLQNIVQNIDNEK